MSHKWSSTLRMPKYRQFIQTTAATTTRILFNASHETVIIGQKSTIQRWINGMIIGSAPFFIILICWMFVSLCINNLVRFYHHRKNRCRHDARTNDIGDSTSNINI